MFTFVIGNQNRPVVETKSFRKSIFNKQYRTALNIINYYFESAGPTRMLEPADSALQGIAFCGDRGEGKTSAMLSFINILKEANKYAKSYESEDKDTVDFIGKVLGRDNFVLRTRTEILAPIDPSSFVNYNILEVILSEIYKQVTAYRKKVKNEGGRVEKCDVIFQQIQYVKRSIEFTSKKSDTIFDGLEDLGDLSLVVGLRDNLRILIKSYLDLKNASVLIIPIDDMDMKITGTFEMTERLRKYLSMPEVVVLMSVKLDQLQAAVEHALRQGVNNDGRSFTPEAISIMAEKYLTKLLPQGIRVQMPGTEHVFDMKFEVRNKRGERKYVNEYLKDGVLELIFIKTRYLFYNSMGEVSTLLPTNLRELAHLIGMVAEMQSPEKKGDDIHRANQEQFKNYFYRTWTDCLKNDDRIKTREWVSSIFDYTLNKDVVGYLRDRFILDDQKRSRSNNSLTVREMFQGGLENDMLAAIIQPDNYTYNVSIGDLFLVMRLIDREILPDQDYKLIFFIRSLYSIKLYDKYDHITHSHLIFPPDQNTGGIYRNDDRFNNVNLLQRLVGGAYFTFYPSQLIAGGDYNAAIDRRIIRGYGRDVPVSGLNVLIRNLTEDMDEEPHPLLLQLAEFFVLTVSHGMSNSNKMVDADKNYPVVYMKRARRDSDPLAFSRFSSSRGYYEFNVLAPFANMLNVIYAFRRFENGDKLLEHSIHCRYSLLCSMWRHVYCRRGGKEEDWTKSWIEMVNKYDGESESGKRREILDEAMAVLWSDASIRNAEILVALSENLIKIREEVSRKGSAVNQSSPETPADEDSIQKKTRISIEKLMRFYRRISGEANAMTTHRFKVVNGDSESQKSVRHGISFQFCAEISRFLEKILSLSDDSKEFQLFMEIFNLQVKEIIPSEDDYPEALEKVKILMDRSFTLSGHSTRIGISIYELFSWITLDNPDEDTRQKNCLEIINKINYFYLSGWNTKEKVVKSTWMTRVSRNPDMWEELFEDPYFLEQLNIKESEKTF